jgi:GT2 family glycosyltransferase
VIAHNEGEALRRTVHALLGTLPEDGEVVVVDDDSSDGAPDQLAGAYPTVRVMRPAARAGPALARNIGARAAAGGVFVFSDAHVTPPMDWLEPMLEVLRRPGVGAVAPAVAVAGHEGVRGYGRTWRDTGLRSHWLDGGSLEPHPVPLLGGCFMAMSRAVFEDCGGFDEGLPRWGCEDDELSLRLWMLGYECHVVPDVVVTHAFRSRFPYVVESAGVTHNLLRIAVIHLTGPRLAQALSALQRRVQFAEALGRVLESDAQEHRAALARRRQRDDAWFCDRFKIPSFEEDKP